jgi:hypothetical protein
MQTKEQLARVGFEAYSAKADGKAHDGKPIPPWPEIREDIKEKWAAASGAIAAQVIEEVFTDLQVAAIDLDALKASLLARLT